MRENIRKYSYGLKFTLEVLLIKQEKYEINIGNVCLFT